MTSIQMSINNLTVDINTAFQVLLKSEATDDYLKLCVEYEAYDKSDDLRNELFYRYIIAKQWEPISENSVPTIKAIKANGHALYLIKVFEMFMVKPNFADLSMRCLVTGKSPEELQRQMKQRLPKQIGKLKHVRNRFLNGILMDYAQTAAESLSRVFSALSV